MPSKTAWTTERKATFGFILALLLLAIVNISGFYTIRAFTSNAEWVSHTREVMMRLNRVWASLLEAESAARGFVITQDPKFTDGLFHTTTTLNSDMTEVVTLLADNPEQAERFAEVAKEVGVRLGIVEELIGFIRNGESGAAFQAVASYRGKRSMDRIRHSLDAMQQAEGALLVTRNARLRRQYENGFFILTAGGVLQLFILGLVITVFQREGRRRRELMAKLREMSALQQATLDATHYAVVSTNPQGGITFFNRGAEELLGYTAAEMVGRQTGDVFHDGQDLAQRARETSVELGENLAPDFSSIVARARRGLSDERNCLFRRKDGSTVPVTLDTTPMRGADGEIVGFLGIARDISVRLQARAEADEANQERRSMMEAIPDIIIMTSADGQLKRWNHQLENVTELQAGELKDRSIFDLFRLPGGQPPDDFLARIVREGSAATEVEITRRDGQLTPHHFSAAPLLSADGALIGLTGVLRDITSAKRIENELRSSESRLRLIASNAPIGIFLLDGVGRCTYTNTRWREITGLSAQEVDDARWMEIIHPEDRARVMDRWAELTAQRVDSVPEFRCLRHDGSERILRIHATPVLTTDENPAGWVGVLEDVTEQHELYRQTKAAQGAAEEASLAKGMFLANMSHEIRTPLNGVIGMTGLLLDTELSARQRDFAEIIHGSAESLLRLLNDLLDLSKVEAGMLELEKTDFDIRSVVEHSVRIHTAKAAEKKLTVVGIVAVDVPALVQGDPSRLEQVLINLVGNAVKFTAAGEVTVRVERATLSGRPALRFHVEDTGIGISEGGREKLFTAFVQEDGSTTRRFGGTGLGLAISRKIVEQMGGEISVRSELGAGSTFTFAIPFGRADYPETVRAGLGSRDLRALVLDENSSVAESLIAMLGSMDVVAERAVSAGDLIAQGQAAEVAFDLILLDPRPLAESVTKFAERLAAVPALAGAQIVLVRSLEDSECPELFPEIRKPVGHSQLFDTLVRCFQPGNAAADLPAASAREPGPGGLSVLVAEDNPVNLLVITHLLQKAGHRLATASDGAEAVRVAMSGEFDLILMDCEMPEMNGYEAAGALRAAGSQVPVIALTANSMEGDRERCLAAGMDDYLSKPIRSAELDRILSQYGAAPALHIDGSAVAELRQIREPDGSLVFDRLVELFQQNSPVLLAKARRALEAGDCDALRRAAHTLKGSGSTFGALRLAHFCQEVEKLSDAKENLARAAEFLSFAETEYEIVEQELTGKADCAA